MKINREQDETTIEHHWDGFGDAKCVIGKSGYDNGDAKFSLTIKDGGQIWKECDFEVCGPIERDYLVILLKQIVHELEVIDK